MFLISNESWRARSQRAQERLRAQANLAELKALRSQINPHFLFNTLNTIAYLVDTKPDDAIRTIEILARMFRYTLEVSDADAGSLKKELQHIEMYLHIEKLRFTERLHVDMQVDAHLLDFRVPTMLLQPLVENAVHYGADEAGVIRISIRGYKDDGYMRIRIADQGAKDIEIGTLISRPGTGIRNVDQRLKTLFGESLQFSRNIPQGVVAEVRIPFAQSV
jgi:LytS/YehU family sensor histidine kinase